MNFIPLASPDIQDDDIEAVVEVLRSGMLVQGEQVAALEEEVARYVGVRHAIAVSNGTATLHLALMALGIGPGDEVVVPAFSYVATANVVEVVGARCVFADVDRDTFNIDAALLGEAITDRTRAIIPVHEFGLSCDITSIVELASARGIPVIEDAACALGATEFGRQVGGFGRIGSFSLHPRKAVTSGEGGILTTDDDALAARLRQLRNHGIENGDGRMRFVAAGLNYRMTDFQAALVRGQFRRLEEVIGHREELAETYFETLSNYSWISLPATPAGKRHTWQTFHPVVEGVDRDSLIEKLRAAGIGSNYGAQCIPAQRYYREKYQLDVERLFPHALRAFDHGIALPLHSKMRTDDVNRVAREVLAAGPA